MTGRTGLGGWPVYVAIAGTAAAAFIVVRFYPELIVRRAIEDPPIQAAMPEPAAPGAEAPEAGETPVERPVTPEPQVAEETAPETGPEAPPAPDAEDAESVAEADEPAAAPAPDDETAGVDTAPDPAAPTPPRFDLVRVEADGSALVAGKGAPGWKIAVELDGDELAREPVGSDGNFVAFLNFAPAVVPRVLTLAMYGPDGQGPVASDDRVILSPPAPVDMAEAPSGDAAITGPSRPAAPQAGAAPDAAPGTDAGGQADAAGEQLAAVETAEPAPGGTETAGTGDAPEAGQATQTGEGTAMAAAEPAATAGDQTVSRDARSGDADGAGATGEGGTQAADAVAGQPPSADADAAPTQRAEAEAPVAGEGAGQGDAAGTEVAQSGAAGAGDTAQATAKAAATSAEDDAAQVAGGPDAASAAPREPGPETVAAAQSTDLPGTDPATGTASPDRPADADAGAEAETASAPEPAPGDDPDAPRAEVAAGTDPAVPAQVAPAQAGAAPAAPTVILAGRDETRILQRGDAPPEVMDEVALDTISYSDAGEVELSGRGSPAGTVRIYINNRPVTDSRIREDGTWRTDLPDVDKGVYTLRVDEIGADGKVVSRTETPFEREDAEVVRNALRAQMRDGVMQVTVQPGFTLWAIARENYGDGLQYVQVFRANSDRIRDPDLIYPGQIFKVPGAEDAPADAD
ncbi:MAG: LysM peptidoglycan-binding domain-containing protein [Pseudooceanicola sp.]